MFETRSGVIWIAGIAFFALAFLSNGLVPWLMYAHIPEKTVEEILDDQIAKRSFNTVTHLKQMHLYYKEAFIKYVGNPETEKWTSDTWKAKTAELVRYGKTIYVGEGCWHCHSQFVRPVSNEERRFGPVAKSWEYQNELQRPVLFGTRRVGPDLSREGGLKGNDWHAAHFFRPRDTSPLSVMPDYPWFFDGDPGHPNRRGIAIIMYMQFQGSWLESYPHYNLRNESN